MSDAGTVILDHPVIQTKLTELRDYSTNHYTFRSLLEEIAMLMTYEVTRDWPTVPKIVQTPLEKMTGRVLARQVTLVPVLRAGLGMTEGMLRVLPEARVGHLGVRRNEKTLEPVEYYKKLPPDIADTEVLLVDPMLATGGSSIASIAYLKQAGVKTLKFVCLVASPEGVARMHAAHPDVKIYTASIDRQLNEKGYILPGLGDAGDRIFGT
ncbi:MAG: uracil phosphoribosyltransferase [Tepidisphaeraceae bacterium]